MSDTPRRWFRFRLRTLLVLTFLTVVGLSIYSYWSDYRDQALRRERELLSPTRGAHCTVVFRGDVLETNGANPQPYQAAEVVSRSAQGALVMTNEQWIVLSGPRDGEQLWVPRENVLLLKVEGP